jgi:hypothetical protein
MTDYNKQIEALQQGVGVGADASQQAGAAVPPPPAAAAVAPPSQAPRQLGAPMGRRYGFLCTYCSSRLEAVESMAGQSGTCPTCGNSIVIPILDSRGRLIDPTSGKVIKQDPHPVHAYAAAGHKAPQIVTLETTGERYIKCPRCGRQNTLASNNCLGCGLPFTMEGTVGDSISGTNTWAVASLVLGIVSMAGGCVFIIPPILAIVFGFIAMRSTNQATGQTSGQGLAIAGMILGTIGLVFGGLMMARFFS